jgi:hypothetical protein
VSKRDGLPHWRKRRARDKDPPIQDAPRPRESGDLSQLFGLFYVPVFTVFLLEEHTWNTVGTLCSEHARNTLGTQEHASSNILSISPLTVLLKTRVFEASMLFLHLFFPYRVPAFGTRLGIGFHDDILVLLPLFFDSEIAFFDEKIYSQIDGLRLVS